MDTGGQIFLEINEWGFGGKAIDASRPKAVVWGDSVVFGYGMGWVSLMGQADAPHGWQFLNGGIPSEQAS